MFNLFEQPQPKGVSMALKPATKPSDSTIQRFNSFNCIVVIGSLVIGHCAPTPPLANTAQRIPKILQAISFPDRTSNPHRPAFEPKRAQLSRQPQFVDRPASMCLTKHRRLSYVIDALTSQSQRATANVLRARLDCDRVPTLAPGTLAQR